MFKSFISLPKINCPKGSSRREENNWPSSLPASWRMSGASWQAQQGGGGGGHFTETSALSAGKAGEEKHIGKMCRWNKASNITITLRNGSMRNISWKGCGVWTAENKQTCKKQIQSPKLQNHLLQKAKLMPSSRCKIHHKLNYNGELGMALGSLLHGAEKSSWQLPAPVLYCWWGLAVTTKGKYYCFTSQGFYYQQTTNPPFLSSIEWSLRAASQVALKLPPRHACLTQQEKCWLLLTSKCDWSGWIWKQGAPLV